MTENENVQEELNLDKKVTVKSIAAWTTGFTRIIDGYGDVTIPPNGTVRLTRNEIISQVQSGNKLLSGIDGFGSHATLYVDDAPTRVELGFESEDGSTTQDVFSEAKIQNLFKIKNQKSFERDFAEAIVTRAEKNAAIEAIKKLGLNDYSKIRFVERYTGYKLDA